MKKLILFLSIFLLTNLSYAGETYNPHTGKLDKITTIKEEDGSPNVYAPEILKVTNGTLTDNGDGSVSINISGGGGVSGITAESDTLYSVCSREAIAGTKMYASGIIVTSGDATATGTVVDAVYLENSSGAGVTARGNLSVLGTLSINTLAVGGSGASTFTDGVILPDISPTADSTTAIQFKKADETTVVANIDTTNSRVGIGTASPSTPLDVNGVITATGGNSTNWNNAYGWGNHATANYLSSETDTLYSVVSRGAVAGTSVYASALIVTSGDATVTGTVVDAQYLEYAGGTGVMVRDNLTVNGIITNEFEKCAVIENLVDTDDNMSLGFFQRPTTITGVACSYVGTGTTVATITLEDGSGNAMTITGTNPLCQPHGTDTNFSAVTAGNTLNAGEIVRFDVTNTPDPTTDDYTLCLRCKYTP